MDDELTFLDNVENKIKLENKQQEKVTLVALKVVIGLCTVNKLDKLSFKLKRLEMKISFKEVEYSEE